ncbi:hypothetical protein GCM10022393_41490 [Aquimarina addita]|uniref:SnoaL-like domain-containing protein n=1 Tax=Aquimarina addita TaxID=870485 RepID=A0ABP6UU55_9FLAO
MTRKEIAEKYIELLSTGDTERIIGLFAKNGKVHSPIYGEQFSTTFYKELNNDTLNSELQVKEIFENSETNTLALYFEYQWTVRSGKKVTFDVVDIIEFNDQNKILDLRIIYDTAVSRILVEELKE